jgi:two-component system, response regulator YesN
MDRGETTPSAVLVVDDEAAIGDVMRRMLRRLLPTATVDAVLSAAQAIEMLMVQPIDLVLTDLRMPGMDGVQLAQLIRARWPKIRVVLFSGTAAESLERAAEVVHADGYFKKPFSLESVSRVVQQVLGT